MRSSFQVIFVTLLLAGNCFAGNSSVRYLMYKSGEGAGKVWTSFDLRCDDGVVRKGLSTLPTGETVTGVIESREFECPDKLSFWMAGASNQKKSRVTLVDCSGGQVIKSEPPPHRDFGSKYDWELAANIGRRVKLVFEDGDTGTGWAWVAFAGVEPVSLDKPSDWSEVPMISKPVNVTRVPFLQGGCLTTSPEGGSVDVNLHGVKAETLYLLGGVNSHDEANPPWGGCDGYRNIFLGDSAGEVRITYASGVVDTVPLVFGYTIWFRGPYNHAAAPFRTEPDSREKLDRVLHVANGIEGGDKPYFLKITLRGEPVNGITFVDNKDKIGFPHFDGITLGGVNDVPNVPVFEAAQAESVEDNADWLSKHVIDSANPYPPDRRKALSDLARRFYTYSEDITTDVVASIKPDITASNYAGPKVKFFGPPEADILTNVYYENSHGMAGRVDDDGTVHESAAKADNYPTYGAWVPELQPFYTASYTRIRALMLLSNAGIIDKAQKGIDYFNDWMMYYPRSFPTIQMGGKPVPAHASVIANKPHVYFDELKAVGWPTKLKTRDYGNPETDGHGLLMLTNWRVWVKQGRPVDWVMKRWDTLKAVGDWIPWCLENPELSLCERGLLYAESEGGLSMDSLYCNMCCYFGLLGFIEMAETAGKLEKAAEWKETAARLERAMESYFPSTNAAYGDVWDEAKTGGWGAATSFAPLVIGADLFGYDTFNRLPKSWAERTRRTYDMQLVKVQPKWCSPAGMGYNQCYYTQTALLLDRMSDARCFTDWMARFCFAPRLSYPYRVPEGAVTASDKSVWRRWGDLGNLYQLAEVVYNIQLILGIDDLDSDTLKLMPRLPLGWRGLEVNEWPVRVKSLGRHEMVNVNIKLGRDELNKRCDIRLDADSSIDGIRLRIGPFDKFASNIKVRINGKESKTSLFESGDSKWAWVELAGKANYRIESRID